MAITVGSSPFNEFPLNRYGSQGPASIAQMGRLIEVWRRAILELIPQAAAAAEAPVVEAPQA